MVFTFKLERRDVDVDEGVLSIRPVYSQGRLKEPAKSSRQRRRVTLRGRVVEALRSQPPRLDSTLLFPAARGGTSTGRSPVIATGHRHCELTSVAQIDDTYGHLLPDSEDYLRGLLNDFDKRVHGLSTDSQNGWPREIPALQGYADERT